MNTKSNAIAKKKSTSSGLLKQSKDAEEKVNVKSTLGEVDEEPMKLVKKPDDKEKGTRVGRRREERPLQGHLTQQGTSFDLLHHHLGGNRDCRQWKSFTPTATVGDLKVLLQDGYPTAPKLMDQRLIFAGSLLLDHQPLLGHVFKKNAVPIPTSTAPAPASQPKVEESAGLRHRFSSNATLSTSVPQSSNDLGVEVGATSGSLSGSVQSVAGADASMQTQMAAMIAGYQFAMQNGLPPPMQVVMINLTQACLVNLVSPSPLSPPTSLAFPTSKLPINPIPAPAAAIPQPEAAPAPAPAAAPIGGGAMAGGFGFMQQDNPDDEFGDVGRNQPQNPIWLLMKLTFLVWMFSHNAGPDVAVWEGGGGLLLPLLSLLLRLLRLLRLLTLRRLQRGKARPRRLLPEAVVAPVPEVPQPIHLTIVQEIQTLVTTFFTSLIPENHEGVVA
ncbi:hypothetical protein BC829DRAFT_413004 [Chytridium lagenaria]|nr:hypothetical protein BC829DRAFT_413004 [Chytridium lagenaria]